MKNPGIALAATVAAAVCAGQGCTRAARPVQAETQPALAAPDLRAIPPGNLGDSIRVGAQVFEETPKYASAYTGNRLSCVDCHIQGGMAPFAAPMVGLPGLFPLYNQRAQRVISLEDRIQDCFLRSENGRRLPWNGPEMIGLISYIQWISRGQVSGKAFTGRGFVKLPDLRGDARKGGAIFSQQCAGCHGGNGSGQPPILPALWGPDAYNDGAGMNQIPKMAAFVQHNMPQNHPGTLTPQQAYDVSAYVASKPHTSFRPSAP